MNITIRRASERCAWLSGPSATIDAIAHAAKAADLTSREATDDRVRVVEHHDEALRRVASPGGPDADGAAITSARAWAEGRAAGLREALAIVASYQRPSASPEPTELDHIVSVIGAALSEAEGGGA